MLEEIPMLVVAYGLFCLSKENGSIARQHCKERRRAIKCCWRILTSLISNILLILNKDLSVRKSKHGEYIFYKTPKMKKPQFLKYNDEKDEQVEERNAWVQEKNTEKINVLI